MPLKAPNQTLKVPRTETPAIIRVAFTGLPLNPKTVIAGLTFVVEQSGSHPQIVAGTIINATATQAEFRFNQGPSTPANYKVTLLGTAGAPAILATNDSPLDGEPSQLPSGNGVAGGNFVFTFTVS